jgi:hypothetical protein
MRSTRSRYRILRAPLFTALAALAFISSANAALPKGIILNLDLQQIQDGLIPNKSLYPLHVPMGSLGTNLSNDRTVLILEEGQRLDIPHSSLLDPDGSGWIASIRVFALSDGIVMSQSDDEKGYVIYIKDGAIEAAVQTGHSTVYLQERKESGLTTCINAWVSIELIIKQDHALLILNRAHVALIPLDEPLTGTESRIRIGEHDTLPAPLSRKPSFSLQGFTGAISSVKILRQ